MVVFFVEAVDSGYGGFDGEIIGLYTAIFTNLTKWKEHTFKKNIPWLLVSRQRFTNTV